VNRAFISFWLTTTWLLAGCLPAAPADDAGDDSAPMSRVWRETVIETGELKWTETLPGQVRVRGVVDVAAEISGEIVEVFAEEGDEVEQGALLVRFETEVFEARLRQAQAQLDIAQAGLEVAVTQLEEARAALERRELSSVRDLVSEEALEVRRNAVTIRQQRLRIAEAEVALASARFDTALIDLERTEIVAPASGQVTRKNVEAGESVNAVQSAPLLFEITRRNADITIYAEVSEDIVGAVSPGQLARVRSVSLGAQVLDCELARVYRRPVNRNGFIRFGVMIDCDASNGALWSGMSVDVDIEISGRAGQALVPVSAFLFAPSLVEPPSDSIPPGHRPLWVKGEDGQIVRRYVLAGFSDGDMAEILSGNLQPTDRVFVPNG
jgi:HlyD family secretion protein